MKNSVLVEKVMLTSPHKCESNSV